MLPQNSASEFLSIWLENAKETISPQNQTYTSIPSLNYTLIPSLYYTLIPSLCSCSVMYWLETELPGEVLYLGIYLCMLLGAFLLFRLAFTQTRAMTVVGGGGVSFLISVLIILVCCVSCCSQPTSPPARSQPVTTMASLQPYPH